MLRREITRIELKPEDKDEFQKLREQITFGGRLKPELSQSKVLSQQAKSQTMLGRFANLPTSLKGKLPSKKNLFKAKATSPDTGKEVEIKLRLKDESAHKKVADALAPHFITTHKQENIFYDGSERELSKEKIILRTRFYNTDQRCLLTIKGQQIVKDGIGRGSEVEEDIDPAKARGFLQDPSALFELKSDILQPILREHAVKALHCLGGFRNERSDYKWEESKLELDKTMFPQGTLFEVEVETEDPETLKPKLEKFLSEHGIEYSYSTTTKFANFVNKTLH